MKNILIAFILFTCVGLFSCKKCYECTVTTTFECGKNECTGYAYSKVEALHEICGEASRDMKNHKTTVRKYTSANGILITETTSTKCLIKDY